MKRILLFIFFSYFIILHSQNIWTVYNTSNSLLPDNVIRAIEFDSTGNAWIGTDNGLAKFDGNNWTIIDSSNSGLPVNQIRSIAFDSANHLWVGTLQAGFSIYDGINWTNYNSGNSHLPDDQVRTISFDANKIAWVGTSGGVAYLSDEGWIIYNMFNSPLGANNINKIFIDANDTKWIGTVNGGISKKTGNTWTTYNNTNSGLTDNTILDLKNDIYGNIWFGTAAQGLGRYNGTNWFYRSDANSGMPGNSVTCLEIVKNTDVKYMGTITSGLVRWNNSLVFDSFTINNSPIPDNHITCLKRAPDGKLWIGTANAGVVVFNDTTTFAQVNSVNDIANDEIKIFPNPVKEQLTVDSWQLQVEEIQITNLPGEIVLNSELKNKKSELDISFLTTGVYILQLTGKNFTATKKFVKE